MTGPVLTGKFTGGAGVGHPATMDYLTGIGLLAKRGNSYFTTSRLGAAGHPVTMDYLQGVPGAGLTPDQQSASAALQQQLLNWGIPELATDVNRLIKQGLSEDAITLQLQESTAYQKRFAGNALRLKKGLAVLSPADYVNTETAYAQVLRQFGMPAGFYDSHDDFTNLIANDVSGAELSQRAQDAQEKYLLGPAENRQWWRDHIGGTDAEAIAAILDPGKAIPLVERRLTQSAIGGAALKQGLQVSTGRADELAAAGVTGDQAQQGYTAIAAALPTESAIAQRFGTGFGQTDLEAATFDGVAGSAAAQEKRRQLNAAEAGLFGGKAAADTSSLSRSTVGSY
jgi:hypothetical protein